MKLFTLSRTGPFVLGLAAFAGCAGLGAEQAPAPSPGDAVDVAAFGTRTKGADWIGVEWENPREIATVEVVSGAQGAPPTDALRLEWWGSVWPNNGSGGWMKLDDPWNGKWVRTAAKVDSAKQGVVSLSFPELTAQEWGLDDKKGVVKGPVAYRRTLKIRVVAEHASLPAGARLRAFGRSRWKEGSFDIEGAPDKAKIAARGIEVVNGVRLAAETAGAAVRLRLLYADIGDLNSNDLTRVTVRVGGAREAAGFSFVPQDVLRDGGVMRVPDLGVRVSETGRGGTLAVDPGPTGAWPKTVRGRVAEHPEATRESAMAGIPRLHPPRPVPLGVPCARQEVVVGPAGDWSMWLGSLWTPGREDERIPSLKDASAQKDKSKERLFRGDKLDAILDTRAEPSFDGKDREEVARRLEEGALPVIHAEWKSGAIRFHHALAATILLGDYGDDAGRRGDETVVLLTKLEVRNAGAQAEAATVNLRWTHPAPIALREDGLVALNPSDASGIAQGLTGVRALISVEKPAGGAAAGWSTVKGADAKASDVLRWQATLEPGETRAIYFKQPYVDLLDAQELERLKSISYEKEVPKMLAYWKRRLAGGMRADVPEPELRHFYDANLWHVAITTDRDPRTGLYNQGVGTFGYKVFANETVMIARSMDLRGEHLDAGRFLEPFLRYQGDIALKGRFSTKDGAFHSAGPYTHGEYAMNHGFVMWGVAEHYLLTRDRAYLERVAPQLVKGCDFLLHERKATMGAPGAPRPPMHGFAPAGSLEDVVEFQYWFSTNGYFYLGLKRVAQALADIGHPEAARIAREAEAYRQDIERAVREAATRAATVRLRDGTWAPYVPSRVFQWRHLTEGWIREALYPSLQLATSEVVPPDDPLITWMLDDLEDNIYFSHQSGYGVKDVDQRWFERGGVTLQPCLVDAPVIYVARGEVPAGLRAFWNTYALLIYPDVQCFAEWAPRFGEGGGPLYKTSDEARLVIWLRQFLLREDGDRLWLAGGVPRAWLEDGKAVRVERAPTWFGPAGFELRSAAARGRIEAVVTLPTRNAPKEVWLRLRHPQGKTPERVLVNGAPVEADRLHGEDVRLFPGVADASKPVSVAAEYGP